MKLFYFLGFLASLLLLSPSLHGMDKINDVEKIINILTHQDLLQTPTQYEALQKLAQQKVQGVTTSVDGVTSLLNRLLQRYQKEDAWLLSSKLSKEDQDDYYKNFQQQRIDELKLIVAFKDQHECHQEIIAKLNGINGNQSNIWRNRCDTLTAQLAFLLKIAITIVVIVQMFKGQTCTTP